MKLQKLVEIKARCKLGQNSLEIEKEHPEWVDCGKCLLGGSVEISTGKIDNEHGIDGVKLLVNPCMLLEELACAVKSKRI